MQLDREAVRCIHRAADGTPLVEVLRRYGMSADDLIVMPCADVHLLARQTSLNNRVTAAERVLVAELPDRAPVFTRGSTVFACTLLALTLLLLAAVCGLFGGILL